MIEHNFPNQSFEFQRQDRAGAGTGALELNFGDQRKETDELRRHLTGFGSSKAENR